MRLVAVCVLVLATLGPAVAFDPGDLIRILVPIPVPGGGSAPLPPASPWNGSRELPSGFEVLRQFDKPAHLPRELMPFCVYSDDPSPALFAPSAHAPPTRYQAVLNRAVTAWNEGGAQLGLGRLFEVVTVPEGADVRLSWTRDGLPEQAVAAVWWDAELGALEVLGLTVDPDPALPDGNRAQILMQELGHVLGLDHSEDPRDLMYRTMHTRRYGSVDQVRPSGRDLSAVAWLYDQADHVPIVGLRRPRVGVGIGRAEPSPSPSPSPSPPGPIFTPVP